METDYSKFKTPFYNIEIGDPSWKTVIKLPENLLRLITKVEVMEAFFTSENHGSTQLTISFVEGFTNKSGHITDLIFDKKKGISSLEKDDTKKPSSTPKFLFQERNKVKITWGYLEDLANARSYMGLVTQVAVSFTESGLISTNVICLPWTFGPGDQLSTLKGKPFGVKKTLAKSGDSLVTFTDIKTDQLIRNIAKDLGMAHIVSKNLPGEQVDKHKQKMWLAGESFQQFMTRLARASGCTYGIETNPQDGKEYIIFIKKEDFEKRVLLSNKSLLHWKNPGSILKNISLTANFGGINGNMQKGVGNDGKPLVNDDVARAVLSPQSEGSKNKSVAPSDFRVQQTSSTTGKSQDLIDTNPIGNYPIPTATPLRDTVSNGGVTGTVKINPAQNKDEYNDRAKVEADDLSKVIQLNFTTIGYTKLTPGIVEILGIGTRYSGKYRIITVTHTIDNSGYITKCSATSQALGSGGVIANALPKADNVDDKKARRVLDSPTENDPMSELQKKKGIK